MIKPLFMWAGGKTRLLKHYQPYMPKQVKTYYDPFFGAGAMFLEVMRIYKPARVIINDVNKDIMRIYKAIQNDLNAFIEIMEDFQAMYIPKSKEQRKEYYYAVRHEHAYRYQDWSNTYEAAVLYFLMKTGFNGIYQINKNTNNRFGTPSGLLNQHDKVYDKDNVRSWSNILRGVDIFDTDWRLILDEMVLEYEDNSDTFLFLDPPYRGCFTSYGQDFTDIDQKQLLDYAIQFDNAHVFLCNRDIRDNFFDNTGPRLNKLMIPVIYSRKKKTGRKWL